MKLISETKLTEKKSKFFAYLYEVTTEDELVQTIAKVKKANAKAAHVCYAYQFNKEEARSNKVTGAQKPEFFSVFKNDGEVGHPGRALLAVLKEHNKTSHLLIVVRFYGGIKLGPGGVSRAFRQAGRDCFS